jgi:hypothetical protein
LLDASPLGDRRFESLQPMADTCSDTVSAAERTRLVAAGGAVVAVHFLGRTAVFVLSEEALVFAEPDGEMHRMAIHDGAILATAADGERIVSGGDDGKVVTTDAGSSRILATDPKHRWIDHIALGPDGAIAWSAGKSAFAQGKESPTFEAPSTVCGLAFFPRGFRLAIAHYDGATLWFPNASEAPPEKLEWNGSHLGATVSPNGRFLVTTMQEPMLHGWRLFDGQHVRMSGYAARVMSLYWSADGQWLGRSRATQLVLWPFHGKDGPMGLALCGGRHRSVLSGGGRLVDECRDDSPARHRRPGGWRSGGEASPMRCCITRIGAANTPASSSRSACPITASSVR